MAGPVRLTTPVDPEDREAVQLELGDRTLIGRGGDREALIEFYRAVAASVRGTR